MLILEGRDQQFNGRHAVGEAAVEGLVEERLGVNGAGAPGAAEIVEERGDADASGAGL